MAFEILKMPEKITIGEFCTYFLVAILQCSMKYCISISLSRSLDLSISALLSSIFSHLATLHSSAVRNFGYTSVQIECVLLVQKAHSLREKIIQNWKHFITPFNEFWSVNFLFFFHSSTLIYSVQQSLS